MLGVILCLVVAWVVSCGVIAAGCWYAIKDDTFNGVIIMFAGAFFLFCLFQGIMALGVR